MSRNTIEKLKERRRGQMTAAERAEFNTVYAAATLAVKVGEEIREARKAAGLTQREMAARMGTSQPAVARLETGGAAATLSTLQRAAAALNLDLSVALVALRPGQ